jgi:hypothetical protein
VAAAQGGSSMIEKIKLSDAWTEEVAAQVGYVGIAYTQMTWVVYLAAKCKAEVPLGDWEQATKGDYLDTWIEHLKSHHTHDTKLMTLLDRASDATKKRNALFHTIWGKHSDGTLGRWRRGGDRRIGLQPMIDLGIELQPMINLLNEIRSVRDEIHRHTRGAGSPRKRKSRCDGSAAL